MNKLESGSASIQSNSSKLAEGSKSLDKGLGDLKSGTGKLSDKLKKAADETGDIDAGQDNYNMIASPVKTENDTAKKLITMEQGSHHIFYQWDSLLELLC